MTDPLRLQPGVRDRQSPRCAQPRKRLVRAQTLRAKQTRHQHAQTAQSPQSSAPQLLCPLEDRAADHRPAPDTPPSTPESNGPSPETTETQSPPRGTAELHPPTQHPHLVRTQQRNQALDPLLPQRPQTAAPRCRPPAGQGTIAIRGGSTLSRRPPARRCRSNKVLRVNLPSCTRSAIDSTEVLDICAVFAIHAPMENRMSPMVASMLQLSPISVSAAISTRSAPEPGKCRYLPKNERYTQQRRLASGRHRIMAAKLQYR